MNRPRVLIADDHDLVVEGFKRLLEPEFETVATAANGREAVEKTKQTHPDVVLMDISMPLLNGIDAARKIRESAASTKILFLSMHADPVYVESAFEAGAAGFLLKRSAGAELQQAIQAVLSGRLYITPLMETFLPDRFVDGRFIGGKTWRPVGRSELHHKLTPRQREVLQLVAEGKAVKEIAGLLGVSSKTVEFHKSRLMDKLGVRTTAELTLKAIRQGLIFP